MPASPGNPPRFDQVQAVAHAAVQIRMYSSTPLKKLRRLYIYTPPQYRMDFEAFPGTVPASRKRQYRGELEVHGLAGVILDNLIAARKAVPMIVVMPKLMAIRMGECRSKPTGGDRTAGAETAHRYRR